MISIKRQTFGNYRYRKFVKDTLSANSIKYHDKSMKHIAIVKNMLRYRLPSISYQVRSLHDIYDNKIVPLSIFRQSNLYYRRSNMGRIKCLSHFKRYKQISLSELMYIDDDGDDDGDDDQHDTLSRFAYTHGRFYNIATVCAMRAKLSTLPLCAVSKSYKNGFTNSRFIQHTYYTRKLSLFKYVETELYGEFRGGHR